jgi:hypothetical protein
MARTVQGTGPPVKSPKPIMRRVFPWQQILEVVAKPHKHFFNVTMTHASWKKATNILI